MIVETNMSVRNRLSGRLEFTSKTAGISRFSVAGGFFVPALGPLLQRRWIIVMLAAVVFAMMAMTASGITTWQCPLRSTLGVPCPGCGLTRAMVLFVHGHWQAAISLHAFAPIVLTAVVLLAIGGTLPARQRQTLAACVTVFEKRTGITMLLVLSALIYWALRILYHLMQPG